MITLNIDHSSSIAGAADDTINNEATNNNILILSAIKPLLNYINKLIIIHKFTSEYFMFLAEAMLPIKGHTIFRSQP